jgi:hypothetical protein
MAFSCEDCGRDDFKSERGLASHRRAKHPPQREGPVFAATELAVKASSHLTDADRGTVAVLMDLARTIDGMDDRDAEAPLDNVTIPTYLKYSDALGLTPLSRLKLEKPEVRGGKLAELRSIRGGRAVG